MAGDELAQLAERVAIITETVRDITARLDSIEERIDAALSSEADARRSA